MLAYLKDINQFVAFLNELKVDFSDCTPQHCKDFLANLKAQHKAQRSITRKAATLKSFFTFLEKEHGLSNCAKQMVLAPVKPSMPEHLTVDQMEKLFACAQQGQTAKDKRNYLILYFMYATGLRISQVILLELADLNLKESYIIVKQSKKRAVPLHAIADLLRNYMSKTYPQLTRAHGLKKYLFPSSSGKPLTRQSFWLYLKHQWKKAGIAATVSPDVIRHSHAVHMLKQGAPQSALKQMLGHQDIHDLDKYSRIEISHLRALYDEKHPRA